MTRSHEGMHEAWRIHKEATRPAIEKALLKAEHDLTLSHGLVVADGEAPSETWSLDNSEVLRYIDQAMEGRR